MGSRIESPDLEIRPTGECYGPNSTEALRVSDDPCRPISAQKVHISRPAPAKLFRQIYLLSLVSLYNCLYIVAWTIICVQTKKPITTHTYSYEPNADDWYGVLANRMKSNAEWFRAAKILLAIANTLIIPLTSTVCASTAVIYVQNFGRRRHFSMQHTATLANKGWSSPQVWLALLSIKGWRSQGSYFLFFAMGFHALGFVISPLQQYYIGQETFKFQTFPTPALQGVTDVYDFIPGASVEEIQLRTTQLRNELASVSRIDLQPNIWQEATPRCSSNSANDFGISPECEQGNVTFDSIAALQDPYVAQLPAGYQTGLLTQFMPRMNSSVSFLNVSQTAFPSECEATPHAYYIEYSYNSTLLNVRVCMLDGIYHSPWKLTRDRQDTTETMFLDIRSGGLINQADNTANPANATFKVTVNTTLGYFELPNYNNSGNPGPLLARDPHNTCPGNEDQCLSQWISKRSLQTNESSDSFAIGDVANLGPLAMIVAAMFEPGSFIATQIPSNGTTPGPNIPCTVPPLNLLFHGKGNLQQTGAWAYRQCYNQPFYDDDGYYSISPWLNNFYDLGNMQNALHLAAILASQVWLNLPDGQLAVWQDMGRDSIRPKIPPAGMILLSILLSIDLLLLLVAAIYISFSYTWAEALDSLAMMRLGAARADELPLQVSSSEVKDKTRATLERMPGWVGDARPNDEVGTVAIGATVPLKTGRRYQVS